MAKRSKKSAGCLWYLLALTMIVLGICCPAIPAAYRYWQQPYSKQFVVPGSVEVQLARSGDYTLWYEYRTVFNGRSYSAGTNLPAGIQISLKNRTTGATVEMYKRGESTFTSHSTSARGVGNFQVPAPGRYVVSVSAPVKQPLVFSFREDWFFKVVGQTVLLLLAGGLLVLGGIAMLVIVFIWRRFR